MTRRKRLCLLLAVLTLLLALSACGAQSKLMLATTGMEPTLDLTLPDTITLPDKGRDTVYKSYVDKAYSMALAAALLDMDADTMQTQLAGRLSYDAQTGYIQYYTPTEELTRGDLSEFPTDAQLEQTVRERLQKFEPELADTSRIVFSSATYETNVSSKTVDVTPEVNGRMVYGQYHISISFDRDGNVTVLTQQYAPLKAVSYTHLDVYKRQGHGRFKPGGSLRHRDGVAVRIAVDLHGGVEHERLRIREGEAHGRAGLHCTDGAAEGLVSCVMLWCGVLRQQEQIQVRIVLCRAREAEVL